MGRRPSWATPAASGPVHECARAFFARSLSVCRCNRASRRSVRRSASRRISVQWKYRRRPPCVSITACEREQRRRTVKPRCPYMPANASEASRRRRLMDSRGALPRRRQAFTCSSSAQSVHYDFCAKSVSFFSLQFCSTECAVLDEFVQLCVRQICTNKMLI